MPQRLTPIQWLICAIAALGFAFDIYEVLVLPLIVGPALMDMAKIRPGTPEFNSWVGLMLFVPASARCRIFRHPNFTIEFDVPQLLCHNAVTCRRQDRGSLP
jgi:hypothetical protein